MGPFSVIWQPTLDCMNVKAWLEEHKIEPHRGWIIRERKDGSYSHEPIEKLKWIEQRG